MRIKRRRRKHSSPRKPRRLSRYSAIFFAVLAALCVVGANVDSDPSFWMFCMLLMLFIAGACYVASEVG